MMPNNKQVRVVPSTKGAPKSRSAGCQGLQMPSQMDVFFSVFFCLARFSHLLEPGAQGITAARGLCALELHCIAVGQSRCKQTAGTTA